MALYQSDSRWGSLLLGHGPSTIGRGGCLLVCLTMAARGLGTSPGLIPPHANQKFLSAHAFDGDVMRIHDAAPVIGLAAPLSERVSLDATQPATYEELEAALVAALTRGMAIVHVDYDATKPGGDVTGDHFVLASSCGLTEVSCLDPAVGQIMLDRPGLTGMAVWGKGDVRAYRARAVRPIRRLPT